jgi:hypothetical protein
MPTPPAILSLPPPKLESVGFIAILTTPSPNTDDPLAGCPTLCGFQRVGTLNLSLDIPTESRSLPEERDWAVGSQIGLEVHTTPPF